MGRLVVVGVGIDLDRQVHPVHAEVADHAHEKRTESVVDAIPDHQARRHDRQGDTVEVDGAHLTESGAPHHIGHLVCHAAGDGFPDRCGFILHGSAFHLRLCPQGSPHTVDEPYGTTNWRDSRVVLRLVTYDRLGGRAASWQAGPVAVDRSEDRTTGM